MASLAEDSLSKRGEILACCRRLSIHSRLEKKWDLQEECLEKSPGGSKKRVFEMVENLYRDHPASVWRVESRKAMENTEEDEKSVYLIYGEVSFIAFARILDLCIPLALKGCSSKGFVFYDLGCGAGRPVFMTALLRSDCAKACGIEIIPNMHQMNQELLMLYKMEVLPFVCHKGQEISFLHGDFLKEDWSDGDVVFANATCFGDPLFKQLEEKAANTLRQGAVVITVTRNFRGSCWEMLHEQDMRMSWSSAKVHVQMKRSLPTDKSS